MAITGYDVLQDAKTIKDIKTKQDENSQDILDINTHLGEMENNKADKIDLDYFKNYSIYKFAKDSNGIYTELQYKRNDGKLYKKSVLSDIVNNNYTVQTITYYKEDGVIEDFIEIWDINYDVDGSILSEVKR